MNKTITMQEILNNKELLDILSTFREEEEIKEFCEENSIEVSPTVLFNLKKTLENQIEKIEKANAPLTTEILNNVAGGRKEDDKLQSGDFGIATDKNTLTGFDSKNCATTLTSLFMNVGLNLIFYKQGLGQTNAAILQRATKRMGKNES